MKGLRVLLGVAVVAMLGLVPPAEALPLVCTVGDPCTLQELVDDDGSITVGDKLFDNFTGSLLGTEPKNPDSISGINVAGLYAYGLPGLQFSGGFFAGTDGDLDVLIGYDVTVLDLDKLLTDIHLRFNGTATGTGFAGVIETVSNSGGDIIGQAEVNTDVPVLDTVIYLDEHVRTASVLKDIFLIGGSDGTASFSVVDQFVSQTQVPEPASMLLLGSGLVALGLWGRKRS